MKDTPYRMPPELTVPTRIECLKPFCVAGKRIEIGECVTLPKFEADGLIARERARLVRASLVA